MQFCFYTDITLLEAGLCQLNQNATPVKLVLLVLGATLCFAAYFSTIPVSICTLYSGYSHIYTDGSNMEDCVSSAVVHKDKTLITRLPDGSSIFRAELYAIMRALVLIRRNKESKFIILSDSISCTSWV